MDKIQGFLNDLREYISKDQTLTKEAIDDLYQQALESIERLAFTKILTQELTPDEQEMYKEMLEMDGEVEAFSFLEGLRSKEEAKHIVIKYLGEEIHKFIHI